MKYFCLVAKVQHDINFMLESVFLFKYGNQCTLMTIFTLRNRLKSSEDRKNQQHFKVKLYMASHKEEQINTAKKKMCTCQKQAWSKTCENLTRNERKFFMDKPQIHSSGKRT